MTSSQTNGLEGKVQDGKNTDVKWLTSINIGLNGRKEDLPLPEFQNRYFKLVPVKPIPKGYLYRAVFGEGPPEANDYLILGGNSQGLEPNKIYRLPDGVTQLHLYMR